MLSWHEELPVFPWHPNRGGATRRQVTRTGPAIDKGTRIAWVMQNAQYAAMPGWRPYQLAFSGATMKPRREWNAFVPEEAHCLHSASSPLKGIEHKTYRALDFSIRIEIYDAIAAIDETNGRLHLEFSSACLIELAATHPRLEDVQLCFGHRAF